VTQTWAPEAYRTKAAFVAKLGRDLIALLDPKRGERVLDLGSGTGELTAELGASGASVLGLDASPEMVEAARRSLPGIEFVVGDGQALEYDAEFDGVFSNAALHWMPDAGAVARGIARALKPKGRFVAEFGGAGCVAAISEVAAIELRARGRDPQAFPRWYFPSVVEYAGVLDRAGLEPRLLHLFERPTPLEGEDGLAEWLGIFMTRARENLGPEWPGFVANVVERCRPRLHRDGVWFVDYVRLRLSAVRSASA
jgi:trans-aconitate methyltransferase